MPTARQLDLINPFRLHLPRARAAFPADDCPLNVGEICA
jgi:hypothetical protein